MVKWRVPWNMENWLEMSEAGWSVVGTGEVRGENRSKLTSIPCTSTHAEVMWLSNWAKIEKSTTETANRCNRVQKKKRNAALSFNFKFEDADALLLEKSPQKHQRLKLCISSQTFQQRA